MEKKKEKNLSKSFWIIVVGVCLVFIVVIASGFAIVSNKEDEVVVKKKNGGNILLNYSDNVDGLNISSAVPTSDMVGMASNTEGSYFDFSVKINLDDADSVSYEISVIKDSSKSTITNDDIKIYLEKEIDGTYEKVFGPKKFTGLEDESELGSEEGSMVLVKDKATSSGVYNYRLRMWLSDTSLIQSGSYAVEVDINGVAK